MQNIEKIKERFAIKYIIATGGLEKKLLDLLEEEEVWNWPVDNKLRTFLCSFGPIGAYYFAVFLDKNPTEETRIAVCKDSYWAYAYARLIDKKPRADTKEAASKNALWKIEYENFEREFDGRVKTFLKEKCKWIIKQFLKWPEQR
jgi:hypothetical protein